jgi:hypothetical protein
LFCLEKKFQLAGVGNFSDKTKPIIFINNKLVPLTDGIAELKLKANKKLGLYKVPISITETKQDGSNVTHKKTIEYNIVDTICK